MTRWIFKIVPQPMWRRAERDGRFEGAPVDLQDGYIHFSTAAQLGETAAKHFSGQDDLLLLRVDATQFGDELKWEPSRRGQLFPHLHAPLDPDRVAQVDPLPATTEGGHDFEGLMP